MERLGSHWKDFHAIRHLSIFRKSVEKIQFPLKSDKNDGHQYTSFHHISLNFSYTGKGFEKNFVEKIKRHIMPNFYNRGVHEIMWKNIVEPNRPQVTISHIRITRWIPKATNWHSDYVILVTFILQWCFLERALLLHSSVHCLSCWIFVKSSCSVHFEPSSFYLNGLNCENRPTEQTLRGKICHRQCGFLFL